MAYPALQIFPLRQALQTKRNTRVGCRGFQNLLHYGLYGLVVLFGVTLHDVLTFAKECFTILRWEVALILLQSLQMSLYLIMKLI